MSSSHLLALLPSLAHVARKGFLSEQIIKACVPISYRRKKRDN
jgi:hypothetical protein